jgi:hypothetical protein
VLVPRSSGTPVATWAWPTWVVSRRRVLEALFILLEFLSPSRRIFIGSHSLPPLVCRIGPSTQHGRAACGAYVDARLAERHGRCDAAHARVARGDRGEGRDGGSQGWPMTHGPACQGRPRRAGPAGPLRGSTSRAWAWSAMFKIRLALFERVFLQIFELKWSKR